MRSKSIINWQQSPDNVEITKNNIRLRRGETVELYPPKIEEEEDIETKPDEKTQIKKATLKKSKSSYDVVANSTHAIILGKYGKFQSR